MSTRMVCTCRPSATDAVIYAFWHAVVYSVSKADGLASNGYDMSTIHNSSSCNAASTLHASHLSCVSLILHACPLGCAVVLCMHAL